jgi:hypothetical protein
MSDHIRGAMTKNHRAQTPLGNNTLVWQAPDPVVLGLAQCHAHREWAWHHARSTCWALHMRQANQRLGLTHFLISSAGSVVHGKSSSFLDLTVHARERPVQRCFGPFRHDILKKKRESITSNSSISRSSSFSRGVGSQQEKWDDIISL